MSASSLKLQTKDGLSFEIPEGGSLGLLALGYRGLMLWRQKRNQLQEERSDDIKQQEKSINEE